MESPDKKTSSSRMDYWKVHRAKRIAIDIGNYVYYAVRRFYADQGAQSAGALTYTSLLALVPLLAIAFAIFSAFPAFETIQDRFEAMLFENLVPEVGYEVRRYIADFTQNTTNLTAVGVVALGVSAVLLLAMIEATFNRIWRVQRNRPLVSRLLIFWTMLTLGPLLLAASFSMTSDAFVAIQRLAWHGADVVPIDLTSNLGIFKRLFAALIQTAAFTVMFMLVPARHVRLRDALIGGAVSGIALELLKWGFRWYLTSFPTYQTIYGAVAVVPIFLIWLYMAWTIVLFGAVFAASFPEWWRSRVPGVTATLSPALRLEAAVALIAVISAKARTGGTVDSETLADALPLDARDAVIESLRAAGYVAATDEDNYSLTRDLRHATVADLARDLGVTLGLVREREQNKMMTRVLDGRLGPVPSLLRDLADAEDRLLSVPLSEVIDQSIRERAPEWKAKGVITVLPGTEAPRNGGAASAE
ncbi:YihY family inner membrane protein [Thalassobaculum sp. OXR-137]|uniref:YihY family inner membrane protein n=1 Tax=Thalassobaculum sp. OXR-137 TaxID=3100173 RepID=UPI002AC96667|nr:YihY family inner membrane protein [Thalassobaculum sp. OXR-137]WPZ32281.1 YihY family inner membrane protein [Thalassobaculum sp. OXR-137]